MSIKVLCPKCMMCGKQETVEVDEGSFNSWKAGELIQFAFPDKDDNFKELLISGTHPECWEKMWKVDEEEVEVD